jgi:hypothetical protein
MGANVLPLQALFLDKHIEVLAIHNLNHLSQHTNSLYTCRKHFAHAAYMCSLLEK